MTLTTPIEQLLGLAFHPDFETNGRFFLHYTVPATGETTGPDVVSSPVSGCSFWNESLYEIVAYVEEWNALTESAPTKVRTLLTVKFPYSFSKLAVVGHDSLTCIAGRTTKLYVAFGDGGINWDAFNTAQTDDYLLGKIFSLDVDDINTECTARISRFSELQTYCPETAEYYRLLAKGLRNPTGPKFDPINRLFYTADAGVEDQEEVDAVRNFVSPNGAVTNFGWRGLEGTECPVYNGEPAYLVQCAQLAGSHKPFAAYRHSDFNGSVVSSVSPYRGSELPKMYKGGAFFVDWSTQTAPEAFTTKGTLLFARPAKDLQETVPIYVVPVSSPSSQPLFFITLGTSADLKQIYLGSANAVYRIKAL